MANLDIWELLGLLAYMAVVAWPVRPAGRRQRLARIPYAVRTGCAIGYFVFVVIAAVLLGMGLLAGFSILYAIIVYPLLAMWSVYRAQDIGWSRLWCMLFLIPPAALVLWLVLLAVPGRPPPVAPA